MLYGDQSEGMTLHQAAAKGLLNEVKDLLAKGADVNAEDSKNRIPLYYAAEKRHIKIVRLLIRAKTNIGCCSIDIRLLSKLEKRKN